MNPLEFFSADYFVARERFRSAADGLGAEQLAYALDSDPALSIDVAILGNKSARHATVVSSGLHGVEGYFGSAAQLAYLSTMSASDLDRRRVVLIHAINPYGFCYNRRCDENNVDLNRNFLLDPSDYKGGPALYSQLDTLLNPASPPNPGELFRAKALWAIARRGLPAVKQAVAGGQYTHPKGLFFGGHGASQSTQIIQQNLRSWIGGASDVVHVDLHTGLGRSGEYKLLLAESSADPWYDVAFGPDRVEPITRGDGTAYDAKGMFGRWALDAFADLNYRFVLAEFGTYGVIRVLAALRAESRAHFHCAKDDVLFKQAKSEIVECFCPAASKWRRSVIQNSTQIIQQSVTSTCDPETS